MKTVIITTSWDDGHRLDMKVAALLDRYRVMGTFYVAANYLNQGLRGRDIMQLGTEFEIGAHSLTHRRLDQLNRDEAKHEIEGSKAYLEDILSRPVSMFCYPRGRYTLETVDMVRKAGFIGARTTEKFVFDTGDPYLMGTTVQCYPYPLRRVSEHKYMLGRKVFEPIQQSWRQIWRLRLPVVAYFNWLQLARATFDHVQTHGGIWHLWGHSWELEKYGMWAELESILQYVSNRLEVVYLTNGDVVREVLSAERQNSASAC